VNKEEDIERNTTGTERRREKDGELKNKKRKGRKERKKRNKNNGQEHGRQIIKRRTSREEDSIKTERRI
jgi:hypothetical protein